MILLVDSGHDHSLVMSRRRAMVKALLITKGNRTKACRILGIGRTTLWRKIKEFEIRESEYKVRSC